MFKMSENIKNNGFKTFWRRPGDSVQPLVAESQLMQTRPCHALQVHTTRTKYAHLMSVLGLTCVLLLQSLTFREKFKQTSFSNKAESSFDQNELIGMNEDTPISSFWSK